MTLTGDENNHLTRITLTGSVDGEATCVDVGEIEAPLGIGVFESEGECVIFQTLIAMGDLIPNPLEAVGAVDDDTTNQVDISFSLLDAITSLPDANAIVPIGSGAVATLIGGNPRTTRGGLLT